MDRTSFEFNESDIKIKIGKEDDKYILSEDLKKNLTLGLGITDRCNLCCPMCYYREHERKNKSNSISLENIGLILSDLKGIGCIVIGLEGEPLCHKNFSTILRSCSLYTKNICIVSNGLLLTERLINHMNEYHVTNLILSCDGSNKEYYEKIRVGGDFSLFLQKTSMASRHYNGQLSIHSVISNQNIKDIHNLPKLAFELGINTVSLAQLRQNSWCEKNSFFRVPLNQLKDEIEKLVDNACSKQIHLIFDNLFANRELYKWLVEKFSNNTYVKIPHFDICISPWSFVSILSDGRLFPCCGDIEPIKINNYDFNSIFNHPFLLKLRKTLKSEVPEVCKKCMYL